MVRGHWASISERFDEYSRILVGTTQENQTMVSKHNRLETSKQIAIEIVRAGEYEITLSDKHPEIEHPDALALGCGEAKLKIGDLELKKTIEGDATQVVFKTKLEKGPAFLQASFTPPGKGEARPTTFLVFRHVGS
jgi:hypothetical protein